MIGEREEKKRNEKIWMIEKKRERKKERKKGEISVRFSRHFF